MVYSFFSTNYLIRGIRNMPHFGLIDENLSEIEKLLLRARLHVRGGKIRIKLNRVSDGIAALYDAMIHAFYWFFLKDDELKPLLCDNHGNYKDEDHLYNILISLGKINRGFNMKTFLKLSEMALNNEVNDYDYKELLKNYNHLMEQLGVIPYDEEKLPKGTPITL